MADLKELEISNLYDLTHTMAAEYLKGFTYPWEALAGIGDLIIKLGNSLSPLEYDKRGENVWVAKSAKVAPTAFLGGPCIIGPDTEVRHCAFIRGKALVGRECVIGNSVELKNVIIFDHCEVPHFNYVGDSILGYRAHMGAGSITSNIKSDRSPVTIAFKGEKVSTGLIKTGAFLGDHVEVGCNSVLNPGTAVGRNTNIYPLSMVRGYVPEGSIYKKAGEVVCKKV